MDEVSSPAPMPGLSAPSWLAPAESPRLSLPGWFGMSGTVEQWTWLFVGLGIALRLCRFALPFPLWCDEFQLADNFLDRDYRGLTEPLNNNQVAPVGFLWAELAATGFLGFHEWSLRLFPCLCGLASMLLMRQVARRLLSGVSQVLAVATLAVAYYPIRLGAEVKPYAGDLMCALVILACVVEWQRDRGRTLWLWVLTAVIAPILTISFPSVFVGGAASLTLAAIFAADWRLGKLPARRIVIPFVVYNLLLVGVFGAIVWMNAAQQYRATANDMVRCWADSFPPVSSPPALALWLLDAHTGVIFAYPIGAENGGSGFTALGCLVGVVCLYRRGPRWLLISGGAAFALTLLAAALHRYPYGGHARLAQHLAPFIILAFAAGGGALIESMKSLEWRRHAWRLACAACLLLALGTTVRDLAAPYKTPADLVHQGFARWFWGSAETVPTVCVEDDLGLRLYGHSLRTPYRCYRRILQKSPLTPEKAREVVRRGDSPVRCVLFHSDSAPRDEAAFSQWMEEMETRYTVARRNQYQVELADPGHPAAAFRRLCYDVYEFVPRSYDPSQTPSEVPLAGAESESSRR